MNLPAIMAFSSSLRAEFAAPLANHLWQSTAFAGVVWLLTLVLRKNRAQARYLLWLIASAKFLFPFSLLVGLGGHLGWLRTPAATQPELFLAMQTIGQPFSPAIPPPITTRVTPSMFELALRSLPTLLLIAWFAGFVAVFLMWCLRWRRLTAARQGASPSKFGRELEALRRMERSLRSSRQIDLIHSRSALEPGIFGIARPVLIWPEGLSERLDDSHLEAILAHELWHVRRRDNLAAAIHMSVEAIFWFHPLVWWLGARLVEERERACDEEVLEMGNDRQVYAEGILKVCEFCLESPLACVSGVTGADIKKRMVYIMTNNVSRKLDFGRKLLLSAAGSLAVLVPIALGLVRPTTNWAKSQALGTAPAAPMFESAMIRPNNGKSFETWATWKAGRFVATNFTLQKLIQQAYGVQSDRITGGPAWLNSEGYDIDAKADESIIDELHEPRQNQGLTEQRRMLQVLLADRFKLALHRETKEISAYALVIAKNGPKLQEATPGDTYPNGFKNDRGRPIGAGIFLSGSCKVRGQGVPIADLVGVLSDQLGRSVMDETGLKGNYDFTLDCFAPLRTPEAEPALLKAVPEHAEALTKVHALQTASLLEAVSEQLGLELNEQTVPLEVLVIDHAEQVTADESSSSQSRGRDTAVTAPAFEAVTIKPNKTGEIARATGFKPDRFIATNVTLHGLIASAYVVGGSEILGGPDWVRSEHYDIEAKLDTSVIDELSKLGPDQLFLEQRRILRALLADRFRLTLHRERREPPAYVLAIAKDGFKPQESKPGDTYPEGFKDPQGRPLGAGALLQPGPCKLAGQGVHMADLAKTLSMNYLGGRTVVDQTGLRGVYDFTLDCHTAFVERGESILTVLPQQLGLELKPLDNLVIDSAEEPSEN